MVTNDIRQAEKNQIVLKAQAVYYSLVSEQQELCKAWQSKGQTPADAAFDGPQGRMAPLKILIFLNDNFYFRELIESTLIANNQLIKGPIPKISI